ncbi:MAG: RNA methyltransferase [Spongiibacteraceae bacterium]
MKFDDVKKLHQKKYRDEFGYFLLEGEHLVLELQKVLATNPLLRESELYVTDVYAGWQSPLKIHLISEKQMAQIAATKTPQGIVAVVPMLTVASPQPGERTIYLHEIQDPGNLGTILRTLAWFGNFRCLLSPNSVDPYNDKVVRASMGAIFHVPIEIDVPFATLPSRFSRIACLDMQGESIGGNNFKTADCYVFGNEARGVPREQLASLRCENFTIAGGGAIESLNLASAVNICVYELSR